MSQREPVKLYSTVAPDLYDRVVNRCVAVNQTCMAPMNMSPLPAAPAMPEMSKP